MGYMSKVIHDIGQQIVTVWVVWSSSEDVFIEEWGQFGSTKPNLSYIYTHIHGLTDIQYGLFCQVETQILFHL